MATRVTYPGDGTNRFFTIPFDYDNLADVVARVNGVEVPFTFVSYSTIQTLTAPSAPIEIMRRTSVDNPRVVFEDGSVLTDNDLNSAMRQLLYRLQEDSESITSSLQRSITVPLGERLVTLPAALMRAGKFLSFDATGNVVMTSGSGADGALRSDLAGATGGSLLGFKNPTIPFAVIRSSLAKAADVVSVLDFGADPTALTDSTDAFNRASEALGANPGGNDTAKLRRLYVPAGKYRLGGTQANPKTFYLRKGQHLHGDGTGVTHFMLSDTVNNTQPVIVAGKSTDGGTDGGGLAVEVSGIWFLGGPASAPVIDFSAVQGWLFHDNFMTAIGQGMIAGGGDGLVSNNMFDLGLTGIITTGQNITISDNLFYQLNYQILVRTSFDVSINHNHFEYPIYNSILVGEGVGSTNIRLNVRGNTFVANAQYPTLSGFIAIRASGAVVNILGGNVFTNNYGYAIQHGTGLGNVINITDAVFQGTRSNPVYDQGTTMGAVAAGNMVVNVSDVIARDMPGPSVFELGGVVSGSLRLSGVRIDNHTGSGPAISITAPGGELVLNNVTGSDKLLFNAQVNVPVKATGLHKWLAPIAVAAARQYVLIPHQSANLFEFTFKANANPGGNPMYRKVTQRLFALQYGYNGGTVIRRLNNATTIQSDATDFLPVLDVRAELDTVNGGFEKTGHPAGGFIAVSWPETYGSVEFAVDMKI